MKKELDEAAKDLANALGQLAEGKSEGAVAKILIAVLAAASGSPWVLLAEPLLRKALERVTNKSGRDAVEAIAREVANDEDRRKLAKEVSGALDEAQRQILIQLQAMGEESAAQAATRMEGSVDDIVARLALLMSRMEDRLAGVGARRAPGLEPDAAAVLVSVNRLVPREGSGVGYELVVKNDRSADMFANAIEISGEFFKVVHGAAATVTRVVYEVELDSLSKGPTPSELGATIYDASNTDFGIPCKGKFSYELDTTRGRKTWTYSLVLPIMFRVPANDRAALRLVFRRGRRRVVEQFSEGRSDGVYEDGVAEQRHELRVHFEIGAILAQVIDGSFMDLVVNREPLSESQQETYGAAMQAADMGAYEHKCAQGERGERRVLCLTNALFRYRLALQLLKKLPADYQGEVTTFAHTIAELDREIATLEAESAAPSKRRLE